MYGKMDGFIQKLIQSKGGINADGEPIEAKETYGDKVPCKYVANTLNNRGRYIDGAFTVSSYIITTKDMSFSADQVRLTDKDKKLVTQKPVQSLEVLTAVKRVRITL